GPGDQVGEQDQLAEVVGEEPHDAPHRAAHYLAYADFLDAALRIEGRQAEKPEAGDHDREAGEGAEQLTEARVVLIHGLEVLAEEAMTQRDFGNHSLPSTFDIGECAGKVIAGDTYGAAVEYRER